jgi:hypothetical protein
MHSPPGLGTNTDPKAARPQGKRCRVADYEHNDKYEQALAQRRTELPKKQASRSIVIL